MSSNIIPIKAFLGKYYSELTQTATLDRYSKVGLNRFFEQRYIIQNNKTQMIVDPSIKGLTAIVSGNEIIVSKELHEHEYINITNSMETPNSNNPKSLYTPEIFSSISYLICQNHTMFNIVGETEEPIYIKYRSEFETFYSSVVIVNVAEGVDVEIVEEFESQCALNSVTNYILHPNSRANVTTFYDNRLSAVSFCLRNVIVQNYAKFSHILFGKGSANVLDETKIYADAHSLVELLGCVNPGSREFHSVLGIVPNNQEYKLVVDQRHIVYGTGRATFTPSIVGQLPIDSYTNINSLLLDQYDDNLKVTKAKEFISPIIDRTILERTVGVERFYNNKSKFLLFQ